MAGPHFMAYVFRPLNPSEAIFLKGAPYLKVRRICRRPAGLFHPINLILRH
jgi:hypothetical protein